MPVISSLGAVSLRGYSSSGGNDIVATGQYTHEGNGAYQWVCPSGVTSVSVVCIGGGGGGVGFTSSSINQGGAGGGASISYKNNVKVTPGTTYILYIGKATNSINGGTGYFGTSSSTALGVDGGYATFGITSSLANSLCFADGGLGGRGKPTDSTPYTGVLQGGYGGSVVSSFGSSTLGFGYGGQGGNGGSTAAAGGGGAGGYNGANGGRGYGTQGAAGAGGGSGAGAGGAGGAAGTQGTNGSGVSVLGTSPGGGTLYGGGGAAGSGVTGRTGNGGAIRIMWPGISRQYPSTIVADQPTVTIL